MERQLISVCLIGGIFGKGRDYRSIITTTPETMLESGLSARSHRVAAMGHRDPADLLSFDIVHVHHLGLGALRVASDNSNWPFVYTSHDGPAMAGLSNGISRRIAAQFVLSRADAVVALTDTEAAFQKKSYGLQDAMHVVIPNGVDTSVFRYDRRNCVGQDRPWELLYVGQLIRDKRVDVLMHAIAMLPTNIRLSLVFHTATLLESLKQLSKDLGIEQRVCFLGAKRPDELSGLYQTSDMLVVPSSAESLPSVVSEAMVCGTPVVATDVGGIRDQLREYGSLVPPGNPIALAEAITSVVENYSVFVSRSESMSQYAQNQFSVDAMVERHIALYRSLLDKKGTRRRNRLSQRPLNITANLAASLLCKT